MNKTLSLAVLLALPWPASAEVAISLSLPAMTDQAAARQVAASEQDIRLLLGATSSRELLGGVPRSVMTLRYSAPAWSSTVPRSQRQDLLSRLSRSWGSALRVEEAGGVAPAWSFPPTYQTVRFVAPEDRFAELQSLLNGGFSMTYDGGSGKTSAPAIPASSPWGAQPLPHFAAARPKAPAPDYRHEAALPAAAKTSGVDPAVLRASAYRKLIEEIAGKVGVDPVLIEAMVMKENPWGDPTRRNAETGATGLGQLMPATAKGLGVKDITDPRQNLTGLVIFVNGFRVTEYEMYLKNQLWILKKQKTPWDDEPLYTRSDFRNYWKNADDMVMNRMGDYHSIYMDGMAAPKSNAQARYDRGVDDAKELIKRIEAGEIILAKGGSIKLVGHSHGGWHSIGIADYLASKNYSVEVVYVKNPHQPNQDVQRIEHGEDYKLVQYSTKSDKVSSQSTSVKTHDIREVQEKAQETLMDYLSYSEFGQIPGAELKVLPRDDKDDLGGHDVFDQLWEIIKIPEGQEGYISPRKDTPKTHSVKASIR